MAIERMSAKEKQMLRELQAKEKRVQRAEAEFLKEADARKDELMDRWERSDRLNKAAEIIGTDADTLFDWITSAEQVAFFKRKHPADVTHSDDPNTGSEER